VAEPGEAGPFAGSACRQGPWARPPVCAAIDYAAPASGQFDMKIINFGCLKCESSQADIQTSTLSEILRRKFAVKIPSAAIKFQEKQVNYLSLNGF